MGLLWNMLEIVKILTVVFLVKIPLDSVAKKLIFQHPLTYPFVSRDLYSYHRLLYTKKNLIMCLFSLFMRNMSLIGQSIPRIPARSENKSSSGHPVELELQRKLQGSAKKVLPR